MAARVLNGLADEEEVVPRMSVLCSCQSHHPRRLTSRRLSTQGRFTQSVLKRPLCKARPRRYTRRHHDCAVLDLSVFSTEVYTKRRHPTTIPSLASPNLDISFISHATSEQSLLFDSTLRSLARSKSPFRNNPTSISTLTTILGTFYILYHG